MLFLIQHCKDSRFCATQCEQYTISPTGSLCKQSLCRSSLTKCIWCLPARVKLWTLLKHFSSITCIFKYYDLDLIVFVQFPVDLTLETFELLLILWVCFLVQSGLLFLESFHLQLGFHQRCLRCDRSTEDKGVFSNPTVLFAELYSFNSLLQFCSLHVD